RFLASTLPRHGNCLNLLELRVTSAARGASHMKFLHVAACLILALPAVSAAPAQTRPAAAPALSRAAQLDLMADFFVPRTAIFALVNKVGAYQPSMTPLLEQDHKAILDIGADAFKLAHREANLYGRERGLEELYADAPIPPLAPPPAGSAAALPAKLPGSFVY